MSFACSSSAWIASYGRAGFACPELSASSSSGSFCLFVMLALDCQILWGALLVFASSLEESDQLLQRAVPTFVFRDFSAQVMPKSNSSFSYQADPAYSGTFSQLSLLDISRTLRFCSRSLLIHLSTSSWSGWSPKAIHWLALALEYDSIAPHSHLGPSY